MSTPTSLPHSWSELSWQQLCLCWQAKMRYGGNADVARVAAMLSLCGCFVCRNAIATDSITGETIYRLKDKEGALWTVNPREASQMARQALSWFEWPYGDPGEQEERDEKGKVLKEGRKAVPGYVSNIRDAMILPETEIVYCGQRIVPGSEWQQMDEKQRRKVLHATRLTLHFALPQVACNNLTWQQYRSLQAIAPQLFTEGISDRQAVELQAKFLAHCLVPDRPSGSSADRFSPKHVYRYDAERAEQTVDFWLEHLKKNLETSAPLSSGEGLEVGILFHICFQCYQTALIYYEKVYPLLFGVSKNDTMRDALTGEVGTVNTVMKYAGYAEQQQVYDSNLPFVLDILNTMAREAKEIEKMNSKIKKK